jgi:hypothetical protein
VNTTSSVLVVQHFQRAFTILSWKVHSSHKIHIDKLGAMRYPDGILPIQSPTWERRPILVSLVSTIETCFFCETVHTLIPVKSGEQAASGQSPVS